MAINYKDDIFLNYANDNINVDFAGYAEISIDSKITIDGTRDDRSNTIATSRSANLAEPTEISITLNSECRNDDGTTIVDILHAEFDNNRKLNATISKGTLTLVQKESGITHTFPEAFLASDVQFGGRTITAGGTAASFTVLFKSAREILNNS